MLQHTSRSIDALCAVDSKVLTDGYQTVNELIVAVSTSRQAVKPRILDGSLIVVVTQREERVALLRAVADREVILLNDTCTRHLVEPIGIACAHCAVLVKEHIHRHVVQYWVAQLVIAPVIVITEVIVRGVDAVVHASLPVCTAPLIGVHRLNLIRIERCCHASVESNLHLAVLTLLGGDDDDTVGST